MELDKVEERLHGLKGGKIGDTLAHCSLLFSSYITMSYSGCKEHMQYTCSITTSSYALYMMYM